MKYIKLWEDLDPYRLPYEDWEMGIIKAWGHLLYLAFHSVPWKIEKHRLVSIQDFKKEFREYLNNSEDEDLQEWMAESPPSYDGGRIFLYDGERMNSALFNIAEKTRLTKPLIVYRYETVEGSGWNSFTTNPDLRYGGDEKKYSLQVGTPVIFTDGLADRDEVIVHMTEDEKREWVLSA